jgi:hypothetical protein
MQVFKNKAFSKWAAKEGLTDAAIQAAAEEMDQGLVDADLGGHVYKKRVAIGARGESGGIRALVACRVGDKAFFVYGFAKNVRANISEKELRALKLYADILLNYSKTELDTAVKCGELIEVMNNG